MKKYLSILSAVLCLGLYSCQETVERVVYDPTVLISNYGLQSVRLVDVEDLQQESYVYVECDGVYDGEVSVKLVLDEAALQAYNEANGTSYRLMPADCYSLDAESKVLTDRQAEFVVTYDVEKICDLAAIYDYSDIRDYVIPFVIVSETAGLEVETLDGVNLILVNPRMSHLMDNFHLVPPTTEDIEITNDSFVLKYKLVTVDDNQYASDYDFSLEVKNADGQVLAAGSSYELICSAEDESFAVGVSEVVYTLKLPKTAFTIDSKWTLKAELKEVEGGFFLEGEGVSNLTFEPYSLWDKSGVTEADLDFNSWSGNANEAPIKLFDGDYKTFWHSGYNGSHTTAPAGKESYWRAGVPSFVGIDFGKELTIHALAVIARQDGNAGRSRAGGFNFDWDTKVLDIPAEEIGNNGNQWYYTMETLAKLFDCPFNWDASYLTKNGLVELTSDQWAPKDVDNDGADNQPDRNWYRETHWTVLDEDVTTDKLQVWIITDSWDFPHAKDAAGGATNAAELEIRLATPALY